jgi:hypothetical protein
MILHHKYPKTRRRHLRGGEESERKEDQEGKAHEHLTIDRRVRASINHIDKQEYLSAYMAIRSATFDTNNIKVRFAATGLVPYDPDRVLSGRKRLDSIRILVS